MSNDPETKLMLAHLENKRIEYASEYARRGRPFADVAAESLQGGWLLAFRAWATSARDGQKYDRRALEDMEAEMYLRGNDPPLHLVKEQVEMLVAASKRSTDGLMRDPKRLRQLEQELGEDLAVFAQSLDDTRKN
jgi:hypothetical protein